VITIGVCLEKLKELVTCVVMLATLALSSIIDDDFPSLFQPIPTQEHQFAHYAISHLIQLENYDFISIPHQSHVIYFKYLPKL
jgi:hypothetical protein